jgi:hypothetical protein
MIGDKIKCELGSVRIICFVTQARVFQVLRQRAR